MGVDGVLDGVVNTANGIIIDNNVGYSSYIAKEENSLGNAAVDSGFFIGFIYYVRVANYVTSSSITTACGTPGSNYGGCSHCPTSVGDCLSNCEYDEYPRLDRSDAVCTTCHANCQNSCVRSEHCSLCYDRECEICDKFT